MRWSCFAKAAAAATIAVVGFAAVVATAPITVPAAIGVSVLGVATGYYTGWQVSCAYHVPSC
jgi:hypothetical protein